MMFAVADENLIIGRFDKDDLAKNLLQKQTKIDQNQNAIYYVVLGMLCLIIVLISVRKKEKSS